MYKQAPTHYLNRYDTNILQNVPSLYNSSSSNEMSDLISGTN